MKINILTLFPEIFQSFIDTGIINRAYKNNLIDFHFINIRNFAMNEYGSVDDYQYGGGSGMVMRFDVLHKALESVKDKGFVILLSADGEVFNQKMAKEFSKMNTLTLICGRYKGVDARIENLVNKIVSIGDYILSGGEVPVMVIIDSVVRLIPGAVGNEDSVRTDSFEDKFLQPPIYTRPKNYLGFNVPEVLISGNHKEIELWRKKEAIKRTYLRRKDILKKIKLNEEEKKILKKVKQEIKNERNFYN